MLMRIMSVTCFEQLKYCINAKCYNKLPKRNGVTQSRTIGFGVGSYMYVPQL